MERSSLTVRRLLRKGTSQEVLPKARLAFYGLRVSQLRYCSTTLLSINSIRTCSRKFNIFLDAHCESFVSFQFAHAFRLLHQV
jgi:hypothetical protein